MKQININKQIVGKKKLGKGLAGLKGEQGTPRGAFGGKSKFQKKLDKHGQSVIIGIMETKIVESEIAKSIEDHLDGCSKQELIELHNFIFGEYINLEDVEWGE